MKKGLLTLLTLLPGMLMAQEATEGFIDSFKQEIIMLLAVASVLLALLACVIAYVALRAVLGMDKEEVTERKPSFWENFYTRFNAAKPEEQVITDHVYDGIKELDNRLPPWWLYGFYFTIFFGVVYLIHFHVLGTGMSSSEEYVAEMQEAEADIEAYLATVGSLIDETNVEMLTDQAELLAGQEMFTQNCSACHGMEGQGGIGPNMVDDYWIHGGDVKDVFSIIKYGVPAKGMIAWENQFSPEQMQQLASFILTLRGTDPPNQKEPQGTLYEPAMDMEAASDSVETEEPLAI